MSAAPHTARAYARTTRDVVGLHGQRRNLYERLAEVGELPPVAIFWGGRDRAVPVVHGLEAVQYLPGVHVRLFDRCGHFPHLEDPQGFTSALTGFLESTRAATTIAAQPLPARRILIGEWISATFRTLLEWGRGLAARRRPLSRLRPAASPLLLPARAPERRPD
jgi:hypothetical protein